MRVIKSVFNPDDVLNPQKLLPSAKSCLELNLSALEAARRSVGSSGPPV
jgi:hypothetical protein